jgi:phenylalanyl-tRNA synthetase beta chain
VLGDILLDVELTPNLARCFSVLGVAREAAALLNKQLCQPSHAYVAEGAPIDGAAAIDIRVPELNPRFTLTLLRGTTVKPSPEWVQRRLRLVGQRPINNIVDATNYITFEIGQPLHAFDYDKLVARAGGDQKAPTIITRLPEPGETLETLDGVKRDLTGDTILVCDTAGVLSLGGIIGGAETEISDSTTNVLLEAANWNYINIRKSMQQQKVFTDAAVRFSRGVHPSQAEIGVGRGIEFMRQWGGGQIAQGMVDEYPLPAPTVTVDLPVSEIERLTGITIPLDESAGILRRLGFEVTVDGTTLTATAPDHRMDIGKGVIGRADLIEEIMRVRGYDTIPNTIMVDAMPSQWENVALSREERARDVLVALGLRENISYRFTTPEREALLIPPGLQRPERGGYVQIINPISPDKVALRQSLLTNLLDTARLNRRYNAAQQVFEIGSVYYTQDGQELPDEPRRLAILISGARARSGWQPADTGTVDFFDLKGIVEGLLDGLHIRDAVYRPSSHPSLHPGRSASVSVNAVEVGSFGELHLLVARAFDLDEVPVIVADFDLDLLLDQVIELFKVRPLPVTPPVLEDIALIVPVTTPAAEVESVIRQAGGELLKAVTLFDVYSGAPVPDGFRSLAYSLVYQTDARTLTDGDVAGVRKKIIKAAEARLGAKLRA